MNDGTIKGNDEAVIGSNDAVRSFEEFVRTTDVPVHLASGGVFALRRLTLKPDVVAPINCQRWRPQQSCSVMGQ